jgi:hypothetical protein
MAEHPHTAFDRLGPVSDRYATLPVSDAFDWSSCLDDVPPGEWYMVAFRSRRRADVDEDRLTEYDDWAHAEAAKAPGFVHYFKGPTTSDGRCMSFCLWDSRTEARAAAGRPAHTKAAALTHEAYAEYSLEFHRVTKADSGFAFEPYDASPNLQLVEPEAATAFVPDLADSGG